MNIAFNPDDWTLAIPVELAQQACAHPEWHGLRMRLMAAIEARDALGRTRSGRAQQGFGSFSRRAARSLERIPMRCDPVNQTSSTNRKPGGCILPEIVGMSSPGGRGQ